MQKIHILLLSLFCISAITLNGAQRRQTRLRSVRSVLHRLIEKVRAQFSSPVVTYNTQYITITPCSSNNKSYKIKGSYDVTNNVYIMPLYSANSKTPTGLSAELPKECLADLCHGILLYLHLESKACRVQLQLHKGNEYRVIIITS